MATFDLSGTYDVTSGSPGSTVDVIGTYTVLPSAGSYADVSGTYVVLSIATNTYDITGVYTVLATGITANAGPDQVADGLDVITLSAAASTGSPTGFAWTQTGGTTVTLTNASTSTATFTAPASINGGTLTFLLTVSKSGSTNATDSIVIAVNPHVEWLFSTGGTLIPQLTNRI